MSRVLVTGANGFIGRRVLEPLLNAGHEVHAVSRTRSSSGNADPGDAGKNVTWHAADLLASSSVVGEVRPELLVHLAWYVEHGKFWSAPENQPWVEASIALLEALAEAGGRRAVIAGTCAEYDWGCGDRFLSERDTPLRPATVYGSAKHELQERAAAFAGPAGLELAWGRVFFLYGADEPPQRFVVSVARSLLAGEPAKTTEGAQVRDFLHVNDVGAGLAALALSDVGGPVNIGSGEGVALRDLAELIGRQTGRPELIELGALPMRPDDPPRLVADAGRLRDEVGFAPSFGLEQGIAATVEELRLEMARATTRAEDSARRQRGA